MSYFPVSNWREKTKDTDLLFCVNVACNVITFRDPFGHGCPRCHVLGSLVRSAAILPLGIKQA